MADHSSLVSAGIGQPGLALGRLSPIPILTFETFRCKTVDEPPPPLQKREKMGKTEGENKETSPH